MKYKEIYNLFKKRFDFEQDNINIPELETQILNFDFESFSSSLLPGRDSYFCNEHNKSFSAENMVFDKPDSPHLNKILNTTDAEVKENINFRYSILTHLHVPIEKNADKKKNKKKDKKEKKQKPKGVIILLHGLNEKDWNKYYPWAYKLMEQTGKMVILFPIAFHMNRVPKLWTNPKFMKKVNEERKLLFPSISNASFANSALSCRLQFSPQRLLWSGLQSFFDIIQLVREIRSGTHPLIEKDLSIDFFAYSIGSFLANILLMTNSYNYLIDSKLFHFCGGPTLNRMSAASKYILDSEANIAVYSYYIEHLEQELKKNKRLSHYFSRLHPEGNYFKCMLDFHKMQSFRENRFHELSKQIYAVALKKDVVVPPPEVKNTLQGSERKIPIKVKTLDFKYRYDHIIPFPYTGSNIDEVDKEFNSVFKIAARHLK